ncbi:DHCW motif cupin fold protein [Bacillus sp. DTU_2020_1000418_1_SI_GHA_SEK_038]|uniref:DHCW motif cupin fold protein n=1 Tax=Bacillus sp. DTU_2020_1000418_1_SI_GHA_SEK_038 TaxID=3077585 RepID=UPI0028E25D28|nr:DHCW motif cupin fold protein [Bacillus sp. DTU_2020_1000418_1_SI_GHA_SEK_038]WNS76232.1 DHCW motif cupin fold protein [Bacillus sp. DTU_2020_1000418_1_SI_GHA_SEK_038]
MKIIDVPFSTIAWNSIEPKWDEGETGKASSKTFEIGNLRVRMIEYSPGYLADHWCSRGHVVLVLEGELGIELADGRIFQLNTGMSFQVAEGAEAHRLSAESGAKVFIVD